MNEKLECCPFCGADAMLVDGLHLTPSHGVFVWCETCEVSTSIVDSVERAISAWNRRPDAPSGWKLVPVEPSDQMLDATRGKNCSPGTWNNWQKKRHATIYRQMVAAAEIGRSMGESNADQA